MRRILILGLAIVSISTAALAAKPTSGPGSVGESDEFTGPGVDFGGVCVGPKKTCG